MSPKVKPAALRGRTVTYMGNKEKVNICPVCGKPVDPREGIYRVRGEDYHRDCFTSQAQCAPPEGDGSNETKDN
jgi:hypothetical protein